MSVKQLQSHILWCRKNGIAWSSLTFGGIRIEGVDLLANEALPKPKVTDAPLRPPSMRDRYGAELLEEGTKEQGMNSVVEEDE